MSLVGRGYSPIYDVTATEVGREKDAEAISH